MNNKTLLYLRRKPGYYHHEAKPWMLHVWPRKESFDWFIKKNRDALVTERAIVKIGRDYFVDSRIFPRVAESLLGIKKD